MVEEKWLYAAIDTELKLLLEIGVYSRRGTGPATAFLHRITENHDVSATEFLVDTGEYLTVLFRHVLSGQLNYSERNHVKKWFQTLSMRIDRFHSFRRAVRPALDAGYDGLDITTTMTDQIRP